MVVPYSPRQFYLHMEIVFSVFLAFTTTTSPIPTCCCIRCAQRTGPARPTASPTLSSSCSCSTSSPSRSSSSRIRRSSTSSRWVFDVSKSKWWGHQGIPIRSGSRAACVCTCVHACTKSEIAALCALYKKVWYGEFEKTAEFVFFISLYKFTGSEVPFHIHTDKWADLKVCCIRRRKSPLPTNIDATDWKITRLGFSDKILLFSICHWCHQD